MGIEEEVSALSKSLTEEAKSDIKEFNRISSSVTEQSKIFLNTFLSSSDVPDLSSLSSVQFKYQTTTFETTTESRDIFNADQIWGGTENVEVTNEITTTNHIGNGADLLLDIIKNDPSKITKENFNKVIQIVNASSNLKTDEHKIAYYNQLASKNPDLKSSVDSEITQINKAAADIELENERNEKEAREAKKLKDTADRNSAKEDLKQLEAIIATVAQFNNIKSDTLDDLKKILPNATKLSDFNNAPLRNKANIEAALKKYEDFKPQLQAWVDKPATWKDSKAKTEAKEQIRTKLGLATKKEVAVTVSDNLSASSSNPPIVTGYKGKIDAAKQAAKAAMTNVKQTVKTKLGK